MYCPVLEGVMLNHPGLYLFMRAGGRVKRLAAIPIRARNLGHVTLWSVAVPDGDSSGKPECVLGSGRRGRQKDHGPGEAVYPEPEIAPFPEGLQPVVLFLSSSYDYLAVFPPPDVPAHLEQLEVSAARVR